MLETRLLKRSSFVFLALGLGIFSTGLSFGSQSSSDQAPREIVDNGSIIMSGTIVDQDGRALSDVSLRIYEKVTNLENFDLLTSRERSLSAHDGGFEVFCGRCSVLSVRFSKDGYFPESVSVDYIQEESPNMPWVLVSADDEAPVREHRGLVVTLIRAAKPVRLVEVSGTIDAGPQWHDRALFVGPGRAAIFPLEELLAKGGQDEQVRYIFLEPGLDGSGDLASGTAKAGGFSRPIPAPATLDFSNAGEGVVIYEPSVSSTKLAFREMKMAPEAGYVDKLTVGPGQGDTYFYCRINGMYGRGRLTSLRFKFRNGKPQGVGLGIQIYLNPDGTRNLEDLRF